MKKCFFYFLCLLVAICAAAAQDEETIIYKSQISTNYFFPIFQSVDSNYERTLGKKSALGTEAAAYGNRFEHLSLEDSYGSLRGEIAGRPLKYKFSNRCQTVHSQFGILTFYSDYGYSNKHVELEIKHIQTDENRSETEFTVAEN